MKAGVTAGIEALQDLTVAELRERYAGVFGEPTQCRHRIDLIKRVAWGIQAQQEGGLSERAMRRAEELARESDLRLLAPRRTAVTPSKPPTDKRLPIAGAVITREYQGRTISVTVLDGGFEYEGQVYRSLTSAVPSENLVRGVGLEVEASFAVASSACF